MYNQASIISHFNRATQYDVVAAVQHKHLEQLLTTLSGRPITNVADIGSGTAMLARLAKKHDLPWHITGVDIAPHMCEQAAAHQHHTMVGDMHDIPMAHSSVDAAISAFALQWSPDPLLAISELARITKPGGTIAILTFLDGTLRELRKACKTAGTKAKTNHFHSADDYTSWCKQAKLAPISQHTTSETTTYATVEALFHTLKQMGATNSNSGSLKGLGNRRELTMIRDAYTKQFARDEAIPASWEIGCWVWQK